MSARRTAAASAATVTGNYFQSLGGRATVGRLLVPSDDDAGAPPAAVISDALWTRAFGREAGIVGRDIVVNGNHVTVVGVADRGFRGINPLVPDLWLSFRGMIWDDPTSGYLYLPATTADLTSNAASLLVQADGTVGDLVRSIADVAAQIDPDAPLSAARLPELLSSQLLPYQCGAFVATAIGALGLGLAYSDCTASSPSR